MDFVLSHPYLIPLLPLVAAAVIGLFGAKYLRGQSHWPIWVGVGASAVLSLVLLWTAVNRPAEGAAVTDSHSPAATRAAVVGHGVTVLPVDYAWFTWIDVGWSDVVGSPAKQFKVDFGFYLDQLTAVMLAVVCGIGFLITIFAAGYMRGEGGYYRFFAYLGLFIFMMCCLVMGNNLVMLYLGWEGVGLCSYLLIGYYYDKPAARDAARKAFLVNRVGDFGFALGIMLCFAAFGTVRYFDHGNGLIELFAKAWADPASRTYWQQAAIDWVPFLLMMGAFGKSAQFPLHVWLPDAMEGPTPVSALIHAATMVTAGVYMIARCGAIFAGNEAALVTVAAVGAFTALFAGSIALRQFDLKKVFAYSTVSQLGFMFVGVGVLAPVAGVFHLVTHAFFKALLFLGSGVVMHAMAGRLDMREMSGLKRVLPKTRWLMLAGCLALAGMAPFAGFFSKDEIVGAAFAGGTGPRVLLGCVLLFTAFLTAYYTFRLYFRVFEGPLLLPAGVHHDADHGHGHAAAGHAAAGHEHDEAGEKQHAAGHDAAHHHNHEPMVMILPLVVLAIGAVAAGFINWPSEHLGDFLGQSRSVQLAAEVARARFGEPNVAAAGFGLHDSAEGHAAGITPVMIVSFVLAALGIFAAYALHLRDRLRAERLAAALPCATKLLEAKYWIDELYDVAIVRPLAGLGRALYDFDRYLIDGAIAAVTWVPQLGGWAMKLGVQRGSLQGYATAMLFGVVVILVFVLMG